MLAVTFIASLLGFGVSMLIMYFVVKLAVRDGMREALGEKPAIGGKPSLQDYYRR